MAGLEPTIPCAQSTWGAAPLHPDKLVDPHGTRQNRKPGVLCVTPGSFKTSLRKLGPVSRAQGMRGFFATQTLAPWIQTTGSRID